MANENEKVLFGAEFEGDNVKKEMDALVENLEKMQTSQKELKKDLAATTAELKKNEKALDEKNKAMNRVLNTESTYGKQLQQEIDILKRRNAVLKESDAALTKSLNAQNREIVEQKKVLTESRKEHELVGKAVEKFTSINHYAAEGVNKLRTHVADAAFGMVSGFAGGIVAAVLPAVVDLIGGLFNAEKALTELEKKQKIVNDINVAAVDIYSGQVTRLELYKAKLNDTNTPLNERIRLVDEYNKIADKGNQIDKTQINNLEVINAQINKQIGLIKQRAIAKAAENLIAEKAEAFIKKQFELQKEFPKVFDESFDAIQEQFDLFRKNGLAAGGKDRGLALTELLFINPKDFNKGKLLKELEEVKDDFDRTLEAGLSLITTDSLTTKPGKDKTPAKAVENVFLQKLAELKAQFAAASAKAFQSESLIQDKFEAQLAKEYAGIAKLLKDKKLTEPQAEVLKALIKQINDVNLEKEIGEFKRKQAAALQAINDSISAAFVDDANKRVANIRDEFEREKEAIEQGYNSTVTVIQKAQRNLVQKIDDERKAGLLSPKDAKNKKFFASLVFGDLLDQAEQDKTNKQLDLSFKSFQKTLSNANVVFEKLNLANDEKTAAFIQEQKRLYEVGAITYEQFQKNMTKALKDQTAERNRIKLLELNTDLAAIQARIKATTDESQLKSLQDQELKIRSQIAAINSQVDKKEDDPDKKRTENLIKYATAVQNLLGTVLSFWQQVNQAEAAALDRSIALQNKRVDYARQIADKGNAEYLEQEQKRLDELTQKREDNARKQIAINNAVTLSQATVAAISAIAKAAETGNFFDIIASVSAVIGAIGAAFNFVNSLQPQTPSFYDGTEYVSGSGVPAGRDKVKANLHVGERVVTANENADYWNTLTAIHNRTIPAEVLNSFVANYPNGGVPTVDFGRLSEATNFRTGFDSAEVSAKLDQLNGTMGYVAEALGAMGFNVNLDEHGFSASLEKYSRQQKIRKRS